MNLWLMMQEAAGQAVETAEHAPETGHGGAAAEAGHGASPWIVEQINHLIGPATVPVQRAIMTPIYNMFGAEWAPPAPGHEIPDHVILAIIAFGVILLGAFLMRGSLSVDRPSKPQQMLEIIVTTLRGMLDDVVGPYGRRYLSVIGAFAVFILVGNLMGLIPGLGAPTGNINTTLALGFISFAYYISRGFAQQGFGYLKHFTGGLTSGAFVILGVVIFFFELLSNFVRPVTLGVRLFLNMFADHTIGGVFDSLAPWIVPIFLPIPLAVFVALVQTMVFIMLSMVYLSETVPHEEHDHDEHGHDGSRAEHQVAAAH
jgi:F-type H+-transporting ATPase subunit a